MASRAILRRKSIVSDYLNVYARSAQSFQSFGNSAQKVNNPPLEADPVAKDKSLTGGYGLLLRSRFHGSSHVSGIGFGSSEMGSSLGMRYMSVSIRNATTVAAKKPEEEEKKDGVNRKEASPEECDQAVESLSSVKAKAKAKRLQESKKVARSILQLTWAFILGIGPALRAVASMSRADWAKKLTHWKQEFVSTLKHYWLGTKLLWADTRISSRLLLKLAGGKSLSRRERQQLTRTTADIFRLVPFAVFILVPFMEFLLPVFLKLFPNMLPSTFQDKMKEEEALKRKLLARIEYAKFLQETAKEMAKEVKHSRTGEAKQTAEDLVEFLDKVRKGRLVQNDEILGFAKLFNDELTLDNISRPRLVSMCRIMGISPYGTDAYLRYMLRKRLRSIKEDDKLIRAEGVDSLSEAELREDCRERGMLGTLSVEEMRQQLRDWMDLSLNHSVPSSLLILSRAFTVAGRVEADAVRATLSSLPDEVVDTVGVTSLPSEDPVSERLRKLEYLEMQDELIKKEEEKEEEELTRIKDVKGGEEDKALQEMTIPTAREAQEQARARVLEQQDDLCKLSRALGVLASASSVCREREEFLRLVKKEVEFYNTMVEREDVDGEKAAMKAYKAAREDSDQSDEVAEADEVSSALMEKVDGLIQNLEKEIDDVDIKIGKGWLLLDRDRDGKVTPDEVAAAAMYLKDTLANEGLQQLISNLSKDKEGRIMVEDIVRLGRLGSKPEENATEEEESN
ncbi:PREDICTED: LETM1 and EF-hand domain-containing protein 1, mitochondrial-like [Brassica oleracea var. oleracea]|uniref:Mitochondrial proton/calcium exchanger protein n=1 Tax=Brassica oleracea var. oleracea TaxID=109376 RepID=A0A0D3BWT0_BRAOL|nr:PREDICTED: LETM1 and EF-hand domain-containing protein 1, mitochondrial-like [Brassica oleracea var. oleracea]XP_013636185.1 PREDICTED: LETM1 and EF-hand domain-containing protein 1, mitochondrial-like [Brassica oleracea var. oleracea]XP_013636186.1 PREDICTED: LETM1 and EF-hand domain-containing protein 1, mitochondrial-like [Brassica oleracea var. oleracea]